MTDTLEDRLRSDLNRVAAATSVPPAPTPASVALRPQPRARKRRRALAAAAVVTAVAAGVPVAAAAGVLPAITTAFSWTHATHSPFKAKDATGHLVLTTQGPPGHMMQLYEATANDGGQCLTLLDPSEPAGKQILDAECNSAGAIISGVAPGASDFSSRGGVIILYGPGAAYLTLSDGLTIRRLPVVDGLSAVWLPASDQGRPLVLTGYDTAGTPIGRFPFVQPSLQR